MKMVMICNLVTASPAWFQSWFSRQQITTRMCGSKPKPTRKLELLRIFDQTWRGSVTILKFSCTVWYSTTFTVRWIQASSCL